MSCTDWGWTPEAVSAIGTLGATAVALALAAAAFCDSRHHSKVEIVKAGALLQKELYALHVNFQRLQSDEALVNLVSGAWPTARQIRALKLPLINTHALHMSLPLEVSRKFAVLIADARRLMDELEELALTTDSKDREAIASNVICLAEWLCALVREAEREHLCAGAKAELSAYQRWKHPFKVG